MSDAVVATGISKRFRLSQSRTSIKDRLFRRNAGEHQDFWAVRELDLSIPTGQTLGILGHNGSGKSTLLKCIAGILKPTTGTVQVRGRVASLLELGAGFHPDLSGRENVYINAAFLGISRREIDRRFDDIVGFAGLDSFIDQQVKYYSSGMFVRLGFAVAVNVDPDILLVDEVLAVGDEVFQQRCLERVEDFQRDGRTILFVTHAADLVRRIADRAIVLDHGQVVADAQPGEAIRIFREHLHGAMSESQPTSTHPSSSSIRLGEVAFTSVDQSRPYLLPGESLRMEVPFSTTERVEEALLALEVFDQRGYLLYSTTSDALGVELPPLEGDGAFEIDIPAVSLLDGRYPISLQLRHHHDGAVLAMRETQDAFEVMHHGRDSGIVHMNAHIRVVSTDGDR